METFALPWSEDSIPKNWAIATIGELVKDISTGFASGAHNSEGRGVHHLRPMNVSSNGSIDLDVLRYVEVEEYDHLQAGDILFNNTNSPELVGKTALIAENTKWAYSNHMTRIRCFPDTVVPAWIAYGLHHLFQIGYFRMHCRQHVNQASINRSFLETQVQLPVPPTNEQHRIVEEIESYFSRLDAAVASLRRAQARLQTYKTSLLKAACEGRLVPTEAELAKDEGRDYESASVLLERVLAERRAKWEVQNPRKRYKEPVAPEVENLAELPGGWTWATLPQIGELNRGKSKHRPRNDERLFGGVYPFIQTSEVKHSKGIITSYSKTYSELGLAQSRLWPKGTLCITIAANIAATGILGLDACFPDSIVGFIANDSECNVRFVELFFRTVQQDLESYAPATAQKNINLDTLQQLAIPLPPLAEQQRIVAEVGRRLSVIDQQEAIIDANLRRAARLRQSILKSAFAGQLAPQDSNDESALELVNQILEHRKLRQLTNALSKSNQVSTSKIHRKKVLTSDHLVDLLTSMEQETPGVSSDALLGASSLDIDVFYAYLKEATDSGKIIERREGYAVFLEVTCENT